MTETKNAPQEIDLIELFNKIGKWIGNQIKWFFNLFVAIFYFFLRNTLWFFLFIIIGIIAAIVFHKVARLYYHTELVGYSHTISNIEVIQSINNWNFSTIFTEDEMNNVKDIGATYLLDINKDGIWDRVEDIDDMEKMDTNIMKQRTYGNFCIQIEVYDTLLIPRIKESVMNYLSNNQRVLERNEIRLRQMEQLIPKLQKEIIELDSLKKAEYFSNNKPTVAKMGEMLLIGEKETKLYHKDVLELIGQQQKIERDLFLNKDPFEIILDFSVPTKEENSLFYLTTRFVGISLIIGFFIILFFDQRKFVFDQIKKSKEK
ncbi:MAG TPA: hypothetical protein DCQ26_11890 [Marinilabiliales bacterium]|nr:MAG: hypothetical protein A2W84_12000 [Bacteroidetes bacterium GWC2_40_13]OFX72178.1 MAG: hypothetical protein A2W96_05720 [Bacteroidetes bacterium GWD2_40_43]OFX94244.1 MAG: hypothetical protein A2W97_18920 [Bacteroidetes bacterium GWE2_40_63]OFY23687.1 MAG: hypothetical protein A2W88_12920 [Bacteroidetes bacterium GWF2_40_13]OFZ25238.1 MAG: hypothetical protein A2437_07605 [Bacteroidetes bacterium RIFOXYC2_FULL_40_12]HAM99298.1 hypothetical protein [Marinilabiliales bacterium]